MQFENIRVYNFENAIRGMRNPKNSWDKSDSYFGLGTLDDVEDVAKQLGVEDPDELIIYGDGYMLEYAGIGPADMRLAQTLIKGGSEHRKFLRQIFVSVDITAPLYWWKEFDTYKVGTVANSTSTMHKLTSKPITRDCFEMGDFYEDLQIYDGEPYTQDDNMGDCADWIIDCCETLRKRYLETQDKKYWKELVRWLPNGWLQTRTVTLNYENLLSMVHQRKNHKLTEWAKSFIGFAASLPYAKEFIFLEDSNS